MLYRLLCLTVKLMTISQRTTYSIWRAIYNNHIAKCLPD